MPTSPSARHWIPTCVGMTEWAGHRTGILAWYYEPISTAPMVGTNNKIKSMKRQAFCYRNNEFFKLKMKALHETKYALVG